MYHLPLELVLKVFENLSLNECFHLTHVTKRFNNIINSNVEYIIKNALKTQTIYGLLKNSIENSKTDMLFHLLKYFIKNQLPFFKNLATEHQIVSDLLGEDIFTYAIHNENIPILELILEIAEIYNITIGANRIFYFNDIAHLYKPDIIKLHENITKTQNSQVPNYIYQYSQNNISKDVLYNKIFENIQCYEYGIVPVVQLLVHFQLFDVMEIILNMIGNINDEHYNQIKYDRILKNSKIMDTITKHMPKFIIPWEKKFLTDGVRKFCDKQDKGDWEWTTEMLLPILKYNVETDIDWKLVSTSPLYFDCVRIIPDHPLLPVIRESSFKNVLPYYISSDLKDIPMNVIVDYLTDPLYVMKTFENKNDDEFVSQLKAMKETGKRFRFTGNFGFLVKFAEDSDELISFLKEGNVIEYPIDEKSYSQIGKDIPFYYKNSLSYFNKRIDKKHWSKLTRLMSHSPDEVLDWIIRCDDGDCYDYFHEQILSFYDNRTDIFIPSPFRSKTLEHKYIMDYGDKMKKYLIGEKKEEEDDDGDDEYYIIDNLLKMSDINIESYWWKDHLSPNLRECLYSVLLTEYMFLH